jgi:transcriptional regulator with XRE-family HTH domain
MEPVARNLEHRVAARLRQLRANQGFTLDGLAKQSGVSRSMISLIERAESSPTASVLDKLAASLGVTLAALFAEQERSDAVPLARRAEQLEWRDPGTNYLRRNLSPPAFPSPIELVEVILSPRARVAYDTASRLSIVEQQVWLLAGEIEVTVGDRIHRLAAGDCLAMHVDRPISFHNPATEAAHYLVALTTTTRSSSPR